MKRLLPLALAGLAGCGTAPSGPVRPVGPADGLQARAVREVVVAWRPGIEALEGRKALGVAPLRRLPRLGLEVYSAADPAAFASRVRQLPGAAWAEANARVGLDLPRQDEAPAVRLPAFRLTAADDPMLGEQWAMAKCRFP
ncbi:MAG: hypothetical protein VKP57_01080, partial [Candidatus Sericytochromatia bacterium]|nr:hypothetical protein [Candidatus Sericytochromatia bacterium]